jgi:hypothetical protein
MKSLPISSLAIGVCLLALSAGVAFADNLHNGQTNTTGTSTTGQTGTQPPNSSKPTIAGCGSGPVGMGAKTNSGVGSPFNAITGGSKKYAGAGAGNSGSNPNSNANSQYDNACAQAQLH